MAFSHEVHTLRKPHFISFEERRGYSVISRPSFLSVRQAPASFRRKFEKISLSPARNIGNGFH